MRHEIKDLPVAKILAMGELVDMSLKELFHKVMLERSIIHTTSRLRGALEGFGGSVAQLP
ncbi:hypothetical protein BGZ99_004706 [Dissophora globulifera]|uniref:Uncharacterized protein n=1 Tax=Dissophora globulifera TaxID=979702 RepID=A0A9P6RLA2_9FUNG|nr:hypothetical protein BGZ99_004706 [Dissophora globulifera]